MVFMGTTPIGAPIVGFISERFGPRAGLAMGGVAILLALAALGVWSGLAEWRRRRASVVPGDSKDRAGMAGPVLRG
jgi:MFS family permease